MMATLALYRGWMNAIHDAAAVWKAEGHDQAMAAAELDELLRAKPPIPDQLRGLRGTAWRNLFEGKIRDPYSVGTTLLEAADTLLDAINLVEPGALQLEQAGYTSGAAITLAEWRAAATEFRDWLQKKWPLPPPEADLQRAKASKDWHSVEEVLREVQSSA